MTTPRELAESLLLYVIPNAVKEFEGEAAREAILVDMAESIRGYEEAKRQGLAGNVSGGLRG